MTEPAPMSETEGTLRMDATTNGDSPSVPSVVPCPSCGQDKWRYLGGDLDHEPPCFACQRKREAGS